MRRLLTMSAAKRDLKKALAGASWVRWRPNPCGKTNYINLCQINRKTHFQPLVCIPYSYFMLSIKKIYLTIIRWVRMGSELIAHEAEGRIGYWLRGHEG